MANVLTCPFPSNVNPLKSNGFMLSIQKLPLVSFFSQTAQIPGVSLPSAKQDTPLSLVSLAGDKLSYEPLIITFIVDSEMNNYKELNRWLNGLGFPQNHQEYTDWNNMDEMNKGNELEQNSSDGVLVILDNSNNPIREVHFVDLIPTSLSSITLTSTNEDSIFMGGVATFDYSYYEFK